MPLNSIIAARFWAKTKPSPDGCLLWQGYTDKDGYGTFWDGERARRAHRVAWEQKHGAIPEGMSVLHRCDNPPCCNEDHLFLGTQALNMHDKIAKGRADPRAGALNHNAKLTAEQAAMIRESKLPGKELATLLGVSPATISMVRNGRRWNNVNP